MNAIILRELGAPEQLRYETLPDPTAGPGRVVVRLHAAAINHRDAWIRKGQYAGIRLPIILGSDGAGVVETLGAGVDPAWRDRDVVINPSLEWGEDSMAQGPAFRILGLPDPGTYAERIEVPEACLFPKPEHLTWEQAAALPLAGLTAYRALVSRGSVMPNDRVLITGIGGGVATMALLIARSLGAHVYVTSGSDEKIARAVALGAVGGVNYHTDKWPDRLQALMHGGPNVIIDSAGRDVLPTLIDLAVPGARIVTYGATTGSLAELEMRRVFWKQLTILGSTMGTSDEFRSMLQRFEEYRLAPVIDRVFPLAEAAAAHQRMEDAEQFGKIVLSIEEP